MPTPVLRTTHYSYKIPDELAMEIGKIIVRWSYFEYVICCAVWHLVGVDQVVGRLAIRNPRIDDGIDLIRDLAELKGINIDALAELKARAKGISKRRDILAHATFVEDPSDSWHAIDLTGTWPKGFFPEKRTTRRVRPHGRIVNAKALRELAVRLEVLIKDANAVLNEVRRRTPSAKKSLSQSPQGNPHP